MAPSRKLPALLLPRQQRLQPFPLLWRTGAGPAEKAGSIAGS